APPVAGRAADVHPRGLPNSSNQPAPAYTFVGLAAVQVAPGVFLRLRKAWRKHGQKTYAVASFATRGLEKAGGTLLPAAPGTETEWLDALTSRVGLEGDGLAAAEALRQDGAVLVVGERLAGVPGALTAALRASAATGARLVWIPRRSGERGAVEAGALPALLPGGRPATHPRAREEVAAAWGVRELPHGYGRDTGQIVEAAATGELAALLVGAVEVSDLPDPARAREALDAAFVVSLELRPSEVTARADVVLPVAAVAEKPGTFLNWEGRARMFEAALKPEQMTRPLAPADARVLHMLADALDAHLALPDLRAVRRELDRLGGWTEERASEPVEPGQAAPRPGDGEAVLAGHRMLLDLGRLQEGDTALAGTRHAAVARLSAATAADTGVKDGDTLEVSGPAGSVAFPLQVTEMPDRVVWLPLNSAGRGVLSDTGAHPGDLVRIGPATPSPVDATEVQA
ncbi:molybdopterin-dependent oxidoreductase, partial [Streptomyces sp. NPDC059556]|uniref:molybdopterin-dependent oxidoreductase n=1 Tax=Streptomyces sp. NPDC059556 TaxID=3346863 RepID=UPI0036A8E0A8